MEETTETTAVAASPATKRLTFADYEKRKAELSNDKKDDVTVKVQGLINVEATPEGKVYFTYMVDLSDVSVDDINWKETVVVRNGKPSPSLRGSVCLTATMPADAIIPVRLPDGTTKPFKIKQATQYGPERYINFTVDPV